MRTTATEAIGLLYMEAATSANLPMHLVDTSYTDVPTSVSIFKYGKRKDNTQKLVS